MSTNALSVRSMPATAWRRAAAYAIDLAVVALLFAVTTASGERIYFLNAALYLVYRAVPPALWRYGTLGRELLHLQLVRVETGSRPRIARLFVREFPVAFVLLSPAAGGPFLALFMLFSIWPYLLLADLVTILVRRDRRSLRDLLAGTEVRQRSAEEVAPPLPTA